METDAKFASAAFLYILSDRQHWV